MLACLKLGILPQVSVNRSILNVQITEELEEILKFTKRVKGKVRKRFYGTKFFSAKQLFSDIVDKVNYRGRMGECVKKNLLIDIEKIRRDILPIAPVNPVKPRLKKILSSDLRMLRVKKESKGKGKGKDVYNFEVKAEKELNKNFIVFTNLLTPLLVSNSHAAVVARGVGKPCVAGCEAIRVNLEKRELSVNGLHVKEGELISINGTTGEVILGKVSLIEPKMTKEFEVMLKMADKVRRLGIKGNADNPSDAKKALEYGAEGIGLCRTEHMFFGPKRRPLVVNMIMTKEDKTRQKYLNKLLPYQRKDFEGIFEVMDGLPVIIRLIDPPMHEFLPPKEELIKEVATLKAKGIKKGLEAKEKMLEIVEAMWEVNPMLGLRGCRAGIVYPQISEMQVRAIFQAAARVMKKGIKVHPEVMIPLVSHINELKIEQKRLQKVAKEVMKEEKVKFEYQFGTMIELPRAALWLTKLPNWPNFSLLAPMTSRKQRLVFPGMTPRLNSSLSMWRR